MKNLKIKNLNRGDIWMVDFNPVNGHEQAGAKPAIVLSTKEFSEKTNLSLVLPITSKIKNYPFEVKVSTKDGITGVALVDQIRSVSASSFSQFRGKSDKIQMEEIYLKLSAIITPENYDQQN